ncbi:urease subunit beta [Nocardiopsis coralliicola]
MSDEDQSRQHPSHPPGSDSPGEDAAESGGFDSGTDRVRSSGASGPSEPRRPGMGMRQSPLAEDADADAGEAEVGIIPGEMLLLDDPVAINQGLEVTAIRVSNTSDRPVQVGSHYHFAEVNPALDFDRDAAWGRRLNVLSGGALRFEPGAVVEVELVPIRGRRIVPGLRAQCGGALDG